MDMGKQRSYWAMKWERMHHMPSWSGRNFSKEDYVDYCVKHYVNGDEK